MSELKIYCERHAIAGPTRASIYRSGLKRCVDLALCLPIALCLTPLAAIVAVLIKLDSHGPVFFVQERLGRFGSTFRTYKFRTMTDRPRVAHTEVLPGHSEVTRVGHWLRRFKIDELPQIWNILNGDMSLVGPRPALPEAIHEYNVNGLRRLIERPGLTGLAQVNGNIYLSWPERWTYDAEYVDRVSFSLDLSIVLKTIAVVLCGEEKFLKKPQQTTEPSNERRAA